MELLDNFILPQSAEHIELLHYMLIVVLFIFIPFAGSGSECLSCWLNNRNFLATEINPEYIQIANERLIKNQQLPYKRECIFKDYHLSNEKLPSSIQ